MKIFRASNMVPFLPDSTFAFMVAHHVRPVQSSVIPVDALPSGQGQNLPDQVCCHWTNPEGIKITAKEHIGLAHQARLKFEAYRWEGEYKGRTIFGLDYVAVKGDEIIAIRSSDVFHNTDAKLRINAALHTLRTAQ